MSIKTILMMCAQLMFIKAAFSQCGRPQGFSETFLVNPSIASSQSNSCARAFLTPMGPIEVSVLADNLVIDGNVAIAGSLPFVGTIALEGTVPSSGQAAVQYGCGNGDVGIFGLDELDLGLDLNLGRLGCLV